jgi:photosystem II stability/assembly factor-like uncharacterized protein
VTGSSLLAVISAVAVALPLGNLHWRSIGPAISGGRTAAVAGSDTDPFLYYFGAMDGGVWKTTDAGATWHDVWGRKPVASIGALAVAPSNDDVVWAGTGEANPRNDTSYGDGVWISADGARSWAYRGLADSFAISRILVSPTDPNVALVGALGDPYRDSHDRGVYRTTDGGRTWTHTLYIGPSTGVSDMAASPDGRTIFAGMWQFRRQPWTFASGGPVDGLYRSRDSGETWVELRGHGLPGGDMGRIGISVSASDPRVVYAVIQSKSGVLWRSRDGGDSWTMVSADTYVNQRPFYMSHVAVDPRDPNHVLAESEDLAQSHDGGVTFANVDGAVHQDHHDLWWSRDGKRLIEADDGGAPISLDRGVTWLWRFNVPIGQVYHLGYDTQVPYQVCGGMQDNDAFCGPSDSLDPLGILDAYWRDVGNDGDGSWVWPDPRQPDRIWNVGVSTLNGQLGIVNLASGENVDVSPGLRDTNGRALAGLPYRFDWQAPIAFSPFDDAAYFGGNVVFKSNDLGKSWHAISPDLTLDDPRHQQVPGGPINADVSGAEFYDTILDIAPSPVAQGVIWVGTDDGLVQLTRDGGATWHNVTMHGVGPYGRVETIEPSHFAASDAFAVVDRHFSGDRNPYVFATRDYGATWANITAGLPSHQYAHVVRQDPRNPNVLFAGLEQGAWVSLDGGASWRSLQLDMPPASVADLRIQPDADDLIAATHGRSFFVLDDLTALEDLAQARAARGPFLFAPRDAISYWRWWRNGYGVAAGECCAPSDRFAGENPPPGALLTYYLSRPARRTPTITILDSRGDFVRTFLASNVAGVNRVSWNLTEAPPTPWLSARSWNQGPTDGANVVPGRYVVRLRADGLTAAGSLTVLPDPRAPWTQDGLQARHDFVRDLDDELGAVDAALNDLDARAAHRALTASEHLVFDELTSNPRNSEDDLYRPDRIREWIQSLLLDIGLSQAPPTPAQREEAARITSALGPALTAYHALPK